METHVSTHLLHLFFSLLFCPPQHPYPVSDTQPVVSLTYSTCPFSFPSCHDSLCHLLIAQRADTSFPQLTSSHGLFTLPLCLPMGYLALQNWLPVCCSSSCIGLSFFILSTCTVLDDIDKVLFSIFVSLVSSRACRMCSLYISWTNGYTRDVFIWWMLTEDAKGFPCLWQFEPVVSAQGRLKVCRMTGVLEYR